MYSYPVEVQPAAPAKSHLFWVGLTTYVVSFLLPSFTGPLLPDPAHPYAYGFHCATYSFGIGLEEMLAPHHDPAVMTQNTAIFLFLSGMINVTVLTFLALTFWKSSAKLTISSLKWVSLLLLPSCWFVFHAQHSVPLAGYYVWTASILILIFRKSHEPPA